MMTKLFALNRFIDLHLSKNYKKEDSHRRAKILTIILTGLFFLSCLGLVTWTYNYFNHPATENERVSFLIPFFFSGLCLCMLGLSIKGYYKVSAYVFTFLLYLAVFQTNVSWGIDMYLTAVLYSLIIVLSGIVIGIRGSVFFTLLIVLSLFMLFQLQSTEMIQPPDSSWRQTPPEISDVIILNAMFVVISLVSVLSSREIYKSLQRAYTSEKRSRRFAKILKKERDQLEILVEEKTKDLRQAQLEKMQQIYSTAELGKTAAGLLHDINTPISVISLNLDTLKNLSDNDKSLAEVNTSLERASRAANKIALIIKASRNQLIETLDASSFLLSDEIEEVVSLFSHRAKKSHIRIAIDVEKNLKIHTFRTPLSQVIANLLSNAIDSYNDMKTQTESKEIHLEAKGMRDEVILKVSDNGAGIPSKNINKLFQPLFTTKTNSGGTGLGLYISKKIVDETLSGSLKVESLVNKGTTFTLKLPKRIDSD